MSSAKGIELRVIGHKQEDDDNGLHKELKVRSVVGENGSEGPALVSSIPLNGSDGGVSEHSHITASDARAYRWKSRLHFAALCYSYFLEGWNDGSLGPLLPRIQQYYNVSSSDI